MKYSVPRRYCAILFCDLIRKLNLSEVSYLCIPRFCSGIGSTSRNANICSRNSCADDRDDSEEHYTVESAINTNFEKEVSIPRRNVDSEGIPISLLGDGFTKRIRLFNNLKKKKVEPQKKVDFAELLPVAVNSQRTSTASTLFSRYPELSQLPITVAENNEQECNTIQYPFSNSRINVEVTKYTNCGYHNPSEGSQQNALSCKEIQKDLLIAREELWKENCGTPDASVPVSSISCGGCGALFHCKDPSLPGYMPSEKFKFCSKRRLKQELCQRCLYMQHFNSALNVSVSPEDYPKIISEIQHKKALAILIVDLTDFPCSLWPGIIDVIGPNTPLFVVGNKIDLLPCDQRGYLQHIVSSLRENLKKFGLERDGNIRYVSLVSAKTGYGIEELITKLHNSWSNSGDIYLVGCTNVGKSTLFNTLLASDLCKVQATDIVQHATISPWPGTTLNLLKFPILRMTPWRLHLRALRLTKERKSKSDEQKLRKIKYSETKDPHYATLVGHVGMTFKPDKEMLVSKIKPFDSKAKEFVYGRFCYDTPGTVYHDQILSLLTVEELMLTLPKQIITPRTYRLSNFQTLFIAGLARVDLLESPRNILITVFASNLLPVHIVYSEQSETFYNHYLGTTMLAVPCGNSRRLQDFPPFITKSVEVVGSGWKESCADISLSSVGWISITLGNDEVCKLNVYTPEGRGCYVRQPSFLPFAVNLRGKRIGGTPAYENSKVSITRV